MFLKRLVKRINEDEIFGPAAQLSYYFLLALFPLLLFLINILGYLGFFDSFSVTTARWEL